MSLTARQLQNMELTIRKPLEIRGSGMHIGNLAGNGVEPDGLRPWQPSDKVREIDWFASARTGRPHDLLTRKRYNDHDVTVGIIVDCAARINFGGIGSLMLSIDAALYATIGIATLALWQGDSVGLTTTGSPLRRTPITTDMRRIRRHLNEVQTGNDKSFGSVLSSYRQEREQVQVIVVISDFLGTGWEKPIKQLARNRELLAVQVIDPWDEHLPNLGKIVVNNGRRIDTRKDSVRAQYDSEASSRQKYVAKALKPIRHIRLHTEKSLAEQLVALLARQHQKTTSRMVNA